jgi:deoxycytidylate deaminase
MARPELIIALVGAAGVKLASLATELKSSLTSFGYKSIDIRLSDLLSRFRPKSIPPENNEFDRIRFLQKRGNDFRHALERGDALALAAVLSVREKRTEITGDPDIAACDHAFVLHQLKHPSEVDLLREVYGANFLLIAGHSPKNKREQDLAEALERKDRQTNQSAEYRRKASELIEIDEKEADSLGQNTRDTYPMADFFSNLAIGDGYDVRRFVDLFFGHPFHTPQAEEYAMYQASAVALRSSDSGRQVGAVIAALTAESSRLRTADIIAVGANEVPRAGGGYYSDGDSPDHRDQRLLAENVDRARELKIGVLRELLEKIAAKKWLSADVALKDAGVLAAALVGDLQRTQFMDIGEFARPVHAEMAALIDAARRGVAVDGKSIYVTTFPCHNCAKHIIAAGISRVVYLDPYPKSRAGVLHKEELELQSLNGRDAPGKVVCTAFSGIAPRQCRQLFAMGERGKDKGYSLSEWLSLRPTLAPPYIPKHSLDSYLAAEREAVVALPADLYRREPDKATLAPTSEVSKD